MFLLHYYNASNTNYIISIKCDWSFYAMNMNLRISLVFFHDLKIIEMLNCLKNLKYFSFILYHNINFFYHFWNAKNECQIIICFLCFCSSVCLQLCGCHHIPVLFRLCSFDLCDVPQRILRVCRSTCDSVAGYYRRASRFSL